MKNNNKIQNNNKVTLYECFHYYQKEQFFTGQNKNYCNLCKQLIDSIYSTKIFESPKILILILNRGKGNINKVDLDFNESIDLTEFVLNKKFDKIIYNLYGVISQIGKVVFLLILLQHVKVRLTITGINIMML